MNKRGWHNESMRHSLAARGIRTRTTITRDVILDDEYNLTFDPIGDDDDYIIIKPQSDGGIKIFYIVQDSDIDIGNLIGDSMGDLIRGDGRVRDRAQDILEDNPYAMIVSVYSHGGEYWFLPEDRKSYHDHWDTADSAGVWYPDKYLMEYLESLPRKERMVEAKKAAKSYLKTYNTIGNGEVYMLVMDEYEPGEKVPYNYEVVGGYVGTEWVIQELKESAEGGHIF